MSIPWKSRRRRLEDENRELREAKADLTTALRLTVEYSQLPAVPGWSWYDCLERRDPDLLRAMQRHSVGTRWRVT